MLHDRDFARDSQLLGRRDEPDRTPPLTLPDLWAPQGKVLFAVIWTALIVSSLRAVHQLGRRQHEARMLIAASRQISRVRCSRSPAASVRSLTPPRFPARQD
jgi:hypothetical protein